MFLNILSATDVRQRNTENTQNMLKELKISSKGADYIGELPTGVSREKLRLDHKNGSFEHQIKVLAFDGHISFKHDLKCDTIKFISRHDGRGQEKNNEGGSLERNRHVFIFGDMTDPYYSMSYVYEWDQEARTDTYDISSISRAFLIQVTMIVDENGSIINWGASYPQIGNSYYFNSTNSVSWEYINETDAPIYSDVMIENVEFAPGRFVLGEVETIRYTVTNYGPLWQSCVALEHGFWPDGYEGGDDGNSKGHVTGTPKITVIKHKKDSQTKTNLSDNGLFIEDFDPWDSVIIEFYVRADNEYPPVRNTSGTIKIDIRPFYVNYLGFSPVINQIIGNFMPNNHYAQKTIFYPSPLEPANLKSIGFDKNKLKKDIKSKELKNLYTDENDKSTIYISQRNEPYQFEFKLTNNGETPLRNINIHAQTKLFKYFSNDEHILDSNSKYININPSSVNYLAPGESINIYLSLFMNEKYKKNGLDTPLQFDIADWLDFHIYLTDNNNIPYKVTILNPVQIYWLEPVRLSDYMLPMPKQELSLTNNKYKLASTFGEYRGNTSDVRRLHAGVDFSGLSGVSDTNRYMHLVSRSYINYSIEQNNGYPLYYQINKSYINLYSYDAEKIQFVYHHVKMLNEDWYNHNNKRHRNSGVPVGSTGYYSNSPYFSHLHFEDRNDTKYRNPFFRGFSKDTSSGLSYFKDTIVPTVLNARIYLDDTVERNTQANHLDLSNSETTPSILDLRDNSYFKNKLEFTVRAYDKVNNGNHTDNGVGIYSFYWDICKKQSGSFKSIIRGQYINNILSNVSTFAGKKLFSSNYRNEYILTNFRVDSPNDFIKPSELPNGQYCLQVKVSDIIPGNYNHSGNEVTKKFYFQVINSSAGQTQIIDSDTNWNGQKTIDVNYEIADNVTLTIEPNTQINFEPNTQIFVKGNLAICDSVRFVSDAIDNLTGIVYDNTSLNQLNGVDISHLNIFTSKENDILSISNSSFRNSRLNILNSDFELSSSLLDSTSVTCQNVSSDSKMAKIYNNRFSNIKNDTALKVRSYNNYEIYDNTFSNVRSSISILESGFEKKKSIMNNTIENNAFESDDNYGIELYHSYADITGSNQISLNRVGLMAIRKSMFLMEGNQRTPYQKIFNNYFEEMAFSYDSKPEKVETSIFYDDYFANLNRPVISCFDYKSDYDAIDLRNNYWNTEQFSSYDFYPSYSGFKTNPSWTPGLLNDFQVEVDEQMYHTAKANIELGLIDEAISLLKQIISQYPEGVYAEYSAKLLLTLYGNDNSKLLDFNSLKNYYLTEPNLYINQNKQKLAQYLANYCDVRMGNYDTAITWYINYLENQPSYVDSCLAVHDIYYLSLFMDDAKKGRVLSKYSGKDNLPKSFSDFEEKRKQIMKGIRNLSTNEFPEPNPAKLMTSNYPNPFNPSTTIKYALPKDSHVNISIYNIKGQKVKNLLSENVKAGHHKIVWDGRDHYNKKAASGVYFYRVETNTKSINKKMLLLK